MLINFFSKILNFNFKEWIENCKQIQRLSSEIACSEDGLKVNSFGIVVTPWMETAVPWLSILTGFLLSPNNRVTFVVDNICFGDKKYRFLCQVLFIKIALFPVRKKFRVIKLNKYKSSTGLSEHAIKTIHRSAALSAIWQLRGEGKVEGRDRYLKQAISQLSISYRAISELLNQHAFDVIYVPGGIWGSSGIWVTLSNHKKIRVATFDYGGEGTLMLSCNGLACQMQDIPSSFGLLQEAEKNENWRQRIQKESFQEMERRRTGTDLFSIQIKKTDPKPLPADNFILIALNSSWDSAALGLHCIYDSSHDWVIDTVKILLENSSAPIIVRQHPAERAEVYSSSDDYKKILTDKFGYNPRILFVAANEEINSYELLKASIAVVAYTSTIGIEGAILGKPVVTESNAYWSSLGFSWKATTKDKYTKFLIAASNRELSLTEDQIYDALSCYYLSQICYLIPTNFNPVTLQVRNIKSLKTFFQQREIQQINRSLTDDISISYLRHLELVSN